MKLVTILASPCKDDKPPFSYNEDAFIDWVDEVFHEGYKLAKGATHDRYGMKRPTTLQEAIASVELHGYEVEVTQ